VLQCRNCSQPVSDDAANNDKAITIANDEREASKRDEHKSRLSAVFRMRKQCAPALIDDYSCYNFAPTTACQEDSELKTNFNRHGGDSGSFIGS